MDEHEGTNPDERTREVVDADRRQQVLTLLAIMAAGAVGAGLRHLLSGVIATASAGSFPWGTLTVNVLGAGACGLLVAAFAARGLHGAGETAIIVGLLGGFTTFSAFAIETLELLDAGHVLRAGIYVLATNTLGLLAAGLGLVLGRSLKTFT